MKLYFKINERLKKIFNYFSIFTIVLGTVIVPLNSAKAADVSIEATGSITAENIDDLLDAPDGTLDIDGTVTATLSLDVAADGTTGIVLGDADAVEAVTLKVVAVDSALTIAPTIKTLNAKQNASLQVQDSTAGAEGDLVTFSGVIGGGAANIIDTIQIGDADEVSGNAKFTADVKATAILVEGGDADENSTVDFANTVAGGITLDDVAEKGNATVVFSGATRTIAATVTAETDGDGTVQVTGTGLTLDGAIGATGIGTLDIDATAAMTATADAKVVDIATGQTFTIDDDFTGDATTLNGTSKIVFSTDADAAAATAVEGVFDGGDDGEGTIQITNTGLTTITGSIGVTKQIGTLDVDTTSTVVGIVDAAAVTVAEGATLKVDDDFTGTTTTLTTTAVLEFIVDGDGAAATTVTGTIDGAAVEGGDIKTNNAGGTTFAGAIGSSTSIGDVNVDEAATFNSTVSGETMDVAAAKVATFKDALTITDDSVLEGQAVFTGTSAYTVNAYLQDGAGGAGNIDVTNTSTGGVTFQQIIGHNDAGADDAIDLFAISNSGSRAVIQGIGNEVDQVDLAEGAILEIDRTVTNGSVVFSNSADTVAADLDDGALIYMPSNLKDGQSLYLLSDVGNTADMATNLAIAIQDNALYTYTPEAVDDAVGDDVAGNDDIKVTANKRTASAIGSQLGTTTNMATGLYEASRASADGVSNDSAAVDAMSDALNGSSGFTTTEGTSLAKQVAPQDDMISGSTFATKAMTGSLQGIMSNRMAALRSGEAYYGSGMSAGANMNANSGFIQVFGTDAEQKNKTVGSGTQFGYDASSTGVALGFDGITDNGSVVGLSLSMSETDVDGKGTGNSKNDIDSYTASIYMDKSTDAGYVEGSLTVGLNENNSSRIVNTAGLDRTYKGDYDSEQVSLKIGGGKPNAVGMSGYVTPFGSITATKISTDAYTETSTTADDSLRLRVAQDDVDSVVGTVGLKYHNVLDNGGSPMISLAINNEFGDSTINSTNTYQGGGSSFKTSTDVEELSATLGLGYSFSSDNASIEFAYEADANEDDYLSHYGSIKLVSKF